VHSISPPEKFKTNILNMEYFDKIIRKIVEKVMKIPQFTATKVEKSKPRPVLNNYKVKWRYGLCQTSLKRLWAFIGLGRAMKSPLAII
jgi:hypothetical protein